MIAYNVPSRTAVDIAPETVARLRRAHANIVGVKETTKDFEHFSRVLHVAGRDTLIWSGIELLCLPLLSLGGAGFVSATANLAPRAVARMYEHWANGEHDEARDLHFALHPVTDVIFTETNPAAAKWVLAEAGLIGSGLRPAAARAADRGRPGDRAAAARGGRRGARRPRRQGHGLAGPRSTNSFGYDGEPVSPGTTAASDAEESARDAGGN